MGGRFFLIMPVGAHPADAAVEPDHVAAGIDGVGSIDSAVGIQHGEAFLAVTEY
jgi:hypothetical protein